MLGRLSCNSRRFILALLIGGLSGSVHAADRKPEEIVAKHLDSIGTADARAIKSRVVQGTLRFKVLVGGGGEVVGTWGRVSQQRKSNFVMRFGKGDWRGEQFIFDGEKTSFAAATASHLRSNFAQFVNGHDFIVKEGLLGGELSTAWALQNIDLQKPDLQKPDSQKLDQNRIKLASVGSKKVDGRELQGIEYSSKDSNDMTVKLYFEPETYRHVMTVYSVVTVPSGVTHGITTSAEQQQIRYTIEERFGDFQSDNGITLPRHYDLQYTEELQSGLTHVYDWDMTVDKIVNNVGLDPGNFHLK
jgi:hypothetical protein